MKRPAELLDMTGKVAVITGGSRGIGRAVAEGFAMAGADVVIASRKLENCELAAKEIQTATGRHALPVGCHVGRWEDADVLLETVYDAFGRCDVLVNNAGMSPVYDSLTSVTQELYDKIHAVNARGPFRLAALFGTRMAEGDGGSIINVTTAGTLRPDTADLPYAMAKAGLNALTLGLAGAWAPKGPRQPRHARGVRHRHLEGMGPGGTSRGGVDESDETDRRARGHGGPVRVPGQRRGQLHQRRSDTRGRRFVPHALRIHQQPRESS